MGGTERGGIWNSIVFDCKRNDWDFVEILLGFCGAGRLWSGQPLGSRRAKVPGS